MNKISFALNIFAGFLELCLQFSKNYEAQAYLVCKFRSMYY